VAGDDLVGDRPGGGHPAYDEPRGAARGGGQREDVTAQVGERRLAGHAEDREGQHGRGLVGPDGPVRLSCCDRSTVGARTSPGTAVYLASEDSRFVTGQVLVVDGGLTVGKRAQDAAAGNRFAGMTGITRGNTGQRTEVHPVAD
jgi:hypothetical protein